MPRSAAGTYDVHLTVSDDDGAIDLAHSVVSHRVDRADRIGGVGLQGQGCTARGPAVVGSERIGGRVRDGHRPVSGTTYTDNIGQKGGGNHA